MTLTSTQVTLLIIFTVGLGSVTQMIVTIMTAWKGNAEQDLILTKQLMTQQANDLSNLKTEVLNNKQSIQSVRAIALKDAGKVASPVHPKPVITLSPQSQS